MSCCVFGGRYSFLGRRLGIGCGGGIPWSLFGYRKEGVVVYLKFFFSKLCAPRNVYGTPFTHTLRLLTSTGSGHISSTDMLST